MSSLARDVDCDERVVSRCCWVPVESATCEERKVEGEMERRWVVSWAVRKEGM